MFHKNLNLKCEVKHPKISYIAACLGEVAKETFTKTIKMLSSPKKIKDDQIDEHNSWIAKITEEIQIFMEGGCLGNLITLEQRNDIEDLTTNVKRIFEYEDEDEE